MSPAETETAINAQEICTAEVISKVETVVAPETAETTEPTDKGEAAEDNHGTEEVTEEVSVVISSEEVDSGKVDEPTLASVEESSDNPATATEHTGASITEESKAAADALTTLAEETVDATPESAAESTEDKEASPSKKHKSEDDAIRTQEIDVAA
eukprot:TRINITY_DN5388_c0_g1_i4.p1 TRINITY_DN5388_c0_g1~~TRINITY_DN5388_c0_g1_i4.p1  ORF type:complete len:156 (+),score=47.04 TRINITY_DN5388_c0_g1_i4:82-549(+)